MNIYADQVERVLYVGRIKELSNPKKELSFVHFFRFLYFAPASNEPQDRNTKQHSDWSWCTVMHSDDLESCVGV